MTIVLARFIAWQDQTWQINNLSDQSHPGHKVASVSFYQANHCLYVRSIKNIQSKQIMYSNVKFFQCGLNVCTVSRVK